MKPSLLPYHYHITACLLFCFSGFIHLQAQPSKALKNLCNRVVASYADTTSMNYGIAIGIIDGPYTYQYYYGKIAANNPLPPDSNSIFLLGSLSKVLTTSLMAAMMESKIISPADTITQYLPDSIANANPFLATITLQRLASHTALLPKIPHNLPATLIQLENTYGNYTLTDLYRFLMHYQPSAGIFKKKSTKQFVYSHTGIGLLAHLLENATGNTLDTLLQLYLGKRCGNLTNTCVKLNSRQQNNLAPGHTFNGKLSFPLQFASMYGSEGIYSTLPDMIKFTNASIHLNTFAPCLHPLFNTQMPDVKVGWGWYVILNGKRQPVIYTHSGKTGGYSNYIAFEKDKQTGVVVLSNSDNRIDKIGIDLLDLLLR